MSFFDTNMAPMPLEATPILTRLIFVFCVLTSNTVIVEVTSCEVMVRIR